MPDTLRVQIDIKQPELWSGDTAARLRGQPGTVIPQERPGPEGRLLVRLDAPLTVDAPAYPVPVTDWWLLPEDLVWPKQFSPAALQPLPQ